MSCVVYAAVNWVLPLQPALIRSLKAAGSFMIWNLTTNVCCILFLMCEKLMVNP